MWDGELINRIRVEVPRYHAAHTSRIVNMLNKLARGDEPLLLIMHEQMHDAIVATVHQYANKRDAEDAANAKQPELLQVKEPVNYE